MTKINDTIRMASMFTMNGLSDPRLFENAEVKKPGKSFLSRKRREFFNLTSFIEDFALKKSIFRYKRIKA